MGVNVTDALQKMATDAGLSFDPGEPILKDVMTTTTANFGGKLPREAVMALIDQTMNRSGWLSQMRTQTVASQKGTIPLMNFSKRTLFPGGEDSNEKFPRGANTSNVDYDCKKARSDLYITVEELREAKALGISDFQTAVRNSWTKALNNDLGDVAINGDTALAATYKNDTELSRSIVDGILKQTETGAQLIDGAGKVFTKGVFPYMRYKLPEQYHADPGLRWFYNPIVLEAYSDAVGAIATTSSVNGMTEEAHKQWVVRPPLGVSDIQIPQLQTTAGPAAAADAASGTSAIKLRCDTAFRGYSATHAGRAVKATYLPTGVVRIGVVADDTSHLEFTAPDIFGQVTADTTASNYSVQVYDETSQLLANPQNVVIFFLDKWDSYTEFEASQRRWHIMTFIELDIAIIEKPAIVKVKGMQLPPVTWT